MSISYTAIIGNKAKVTNPSVESWYLNNNILKDPPKSIMTRRIDKVNQDGSLNEMMYDSGDRFAESLNVYARGVNPMVSVQYTNQNGNPTKMPYRIIRDGAYRPPILTQEQLLPLSRLPRNTTQAITNKESKEYHNTVTCPDTKRYFKDTLKGQIIPTKYVKVEMPVKEHFVVNYVNENPVVTNVLTNLQSKGNTQLEAQQPLRQTLKDPLKYAHSTNMGTQAPIDYIHDDIKLVRNIPEYQSTTAKSSSMYSRIDDTGDILLERNTPQYATQTNKHDNRTFVNENNTDYKLSQKTLAKTVILNKSDVDSSQDQNRQVRLNPTIQRTEFEGTKFIPPTDRVNMYNQNYSTGKTQLKAAMKKVM